MDDREQNKIMLIREFRSQLVGFLDELIEQFPNEGDFVLIRIFIRDQVPMADVLGRFIRDILPVQHQVKSRNERFFLDNTILYTGASVGAQKVNHFKQIWLSDQLDDNDREVVWKWMDLFNAIANKYEKMFGAVPGWEKK